MARAGRALDDRAQLRGGRQRTPAPGLHDCPRDPPRGAFLTELADDPCEFVLPFLVQQIVGAERPRRIHPHVERTVISETEAARRIVERETCSSPNRPGSRRARPARPRRSRDRSRRSRHCRSTTREPKRRSRSPAASSACGSRSRPSSVAPLASSSISACPPVPSVASTIRRRSPSHSRPRTSPGITGRCNRSAPAFDSAASAISTYRLSFATNSGSIICCSAAARIRCSTALSQS